MCCFFRQELTIVTMGERLCCFVVALREEIKQSIMSVLYLCKIMIQSVLPWAIYRDVWDLSKASNST